MAFVAAAVKPDLFNFEPRPPIGPAGLAEAPALFLRRPLADRLPSQSPIDPLGDAPDPALVALFGAGFCLRHRLLPWRRVGGQVTVLAAAPLGPARLLHLTAALGRYQIIPARADVIEAAIFAHFGADLAQSAETRTAAADSCRGFDGAQAGRWTGWAIILIGVLATVWPLGVLTGAFLLALVCSAISTGFKLVCGAASFTQRQGLPVAQPAVAAHDLPVISVMIALYHESDIAPRLIARLSRLDYPRDRLEVLLLVEDDDTATARALQHALLPPWMRVITLPAGGIRTKPRALNVGLDVARGSIIGVYDAEDAPEADQLQKVAAQFAAAPARIACLQAALDFYNPRFNWLARCFTMEYAVWFRTVLPGMARLGLPIPLGGTSLFFRREVLEDLGGWDAHNVTEDADLGLRLHRRGWRTGILPSTTYEEANSRVYPWVRQRSRWIKGYLMTWATHMRAPRQTWRDLGPRGFLAFQVLFLGSMAHYLFTPLLLWLWAVPLGLPHPLGHALPPVALNAMAALFLLAEFASAAQILLALRRAGQPMGWLWIAVMHFYFPLGALAAIKGIMESLSRPFFWDKTRHGDFGA